MEIKSFIFLVHATALKNTRKTIWFILRLKNYSPYKWNSCGGLKAIDFLLGIQMDYTKHQSFLCFWDSRDNKQHYARKLVVLNRNFCPERLNIRHVPLVDQKNRPTPTHIKLDLFKNFVKALNQFGRDFSYLQQNFSTNVKAKLTAGVFIGPKFKN